MDCRVISIGALDAHPLWDERSPVRTGHATTTLIRAGDAVILVDPALPGPILAQRLAERANVTADEVTHVFLTSFRPDVRRGLSLFDEAAWHISGDEREAVGVPMAQALARADAEGETDEDAAQVAETLRGDISLLQRCSPAPDTLAPGVDLFPLPGVTPGLSGLLLPGARHTMLICGDAIPTIEHLDGGIVPRWAVDGAKAKESFADAIEIADLLILGRDNLVVNPTKRPF